MRTESKIKFFFARLQVQGLLSIVVVLWATAAAQPIAPIVRVVDHPELGKILANGEGRAIYVLTEDRNGVSTCYGECEEAWPPVLVDGQEGFEAADELDMLGTTERNDGAKQLTYAGQPLYFFAQDKEPSDINGHGVNDVWFLVRPSGDLVEAHDPDAQEADTNDLSVLLQEGAQVFSDACASCHGSSGGGTGTAPELAGNDVLADGPRAVRQVLFGGSMMPAFEQRLSDRQVAAVLTHIRNSWGNDFGVLSEEEVIEEKARFD